jgi:hypothetical protein
MKLKKSTTKLHTPKKSVNHNAKETERRAAKRISLPVKFTRKINARIHSTTKKQLLGSVLAAILVIVGLSIIPFNHTGTKTVSLDYVSQSTSDPTIELGNTKISQQGVNGSGVEKYTYKKSFIEYLLGSKVTETQVSLRTVRQPIDQVIANGTLRYQYMYCSNGSYRSYTDAQMKDPTFGLTHKSPDYCAANNEGTETQLANTPPGSRTINTSSGTVCAQKTIPPGITDQDSSSLPVGQTQTLGGMIGFQTTYCNGKITTIPPINATEFVGTGTSSTAPTTGQSQTNTGSGNNGISYSQASSTCQSYIQNLAAGGTTNGLSALFASCMHKYGY